MPTLDKPLRLGTRASPLALAQAELVQAALCSALNLDHDSVQICPMTATGDRILDRALADIGGKALWTKELDAALALEEIDFSVHSMKDVETDRPDAFMLAAVLPRADVRDRIIGSESIESLPRCARIGTSAPRRRAQLLHLRPDLEIILFRGNVQTRLAKLANGEVDATLLAAAGLERLGLHDVGANISVAELLPAPQQGVIGIECRRDDQRVAPLLAAIDSRATHLAVLAERDLLRALNGNCRSPIAALATLVGEEVTLQAEIYDATGTYLSKGQSTFKAVDREGASRLAADLLGSAHADIRAVFS